jgi:general secretion pathway protein H
MLPTASQEAKGITVISPVGNDSHGFTLLELVLVLLLLGVSSLIVIPNIEKGIQNREVKGSALALAAVARDLRSRALYDGIPRQLVLNVPQNSYRVERDREVQFPPGVKFVEIEGGEMLEGGARQFLFFPNGSSHGGEIALSDGRHLFRYSIRLEPLTGKIAVSRSDGS